MENSTKTRLVLGVTGGVAAFKAISISNLFLKLGYNVQVVMTGAAKRFISEQEFVATRNPVLSSIYVNGEVPHIDLAQWCEVLLIAPATANTIGKIANGIADNLLTAMAMATPTDCIRVICPAMNNVMYHSSPMIRNRRLLRDDGWYEIEPRTGQMACGTEGKGALADTKDIAEKVHKFVTTLNPAVWFGSAENLK